MAAIASAAKTVPGPPARRGGKPSRALADAPPVRRFRRVRRIHLAKKPAAASAQAASDNTAADHAATQAIAQAQAAKPSATPRSGLKKAVAAPASQAPAAIEVDAATPAAESSVRERTHNPAAGIIASATAAASRQETGPAHSGESARATKDARNAAAPAPMPRAPAAKKKAVDFREYFMSISSTAYTAGARRARAFAAYRATAAIASRATSAAVPVASTRHTRPGGNNRDSAA